MAPALVSAGALVFHLVVGGPTSVHPAFGQATTAGNLLVAWANADGSAALTLNDGTWSTAVNITANGAVTIFYKANCLANETSPTATSSDGSQINAQLAEFSGILTSSPLDKVGSTALSTGPFSPIVVTASGADTGGGNLVVSLIYWDLTTTTADNLADTYGSNATFISVGQKNDTSVQSSFGYAITGNNSIANTDSATNDAAGLFFSDAVIASFKATPPVAGSFPGYLGPRQY